MAYSSGSQPCLPHAALSPFVIMSNIFYFTRCIPNNIRINQYSDSLSLPICGSQLSTFNRSSSSETLEFSPGWEALAYRLSYLFKSSYVIGVLRLSGGIRVTSLQR